MILSPVISRRIADRAGRIAFGLGLKERLGNFALAEILAAVPVIFGARLGYIDDYVFAGPTRGFVSICRIAGLIVGSHLVCIDIF